MFCDAQKFKSKKSIMKIFLCFLYVVMLILCFLSFAYGIHQGNIEGTLQSVGAVVLAMFVIGKLQDQL